MAKCRGNCLLLPANRVGIGGKVSWELSVAAREQTGNRWQSVVGIACGLAGAKLRTMALRLISVVASGELKVGQL